MKTVQVVICAGTTCYILGSSHLCNIAEHLTPAEQARVEISGARCLGMCKNGYYFQAPYVQVNGEVMVEATVPKVLARIRELLAVE